MPRRPATGWSSSSTTTTCRSRRRSAGSRLSRAAGLVGQISRPARARPAASRASCPSRSTAPRDKAEELPAAWRWAAPCSRNWASIMSARSTATISTQLVPVLENVRDAAEGPMPGPCRHQEGQGLCARPRQPPTNITASASSTSSPASRPRGRRRPASYTERVRRGADRRSWRATTKIVRDHRGDAVGHRARQVRQGAFPTAPSTSASPNSMR